MELSNIPESLREIHNWVLWLRKDVKGKAKKIPINPKTLRAASTTDSSTWSVFDLSVSCLYNEKKRHDGIGFVFPLDGSITGVDFDNKGGPQIKCLEDCPQEVQDIVSALDSYTEISPSGTGLHVIALGGLPESVRHKKRLDCGWDFEIYDRGRFFTVTGRSLNGGLAERQAELITLCARLFPEVKGESATAIQVKDKGDKARAVQSSPVADVDLLLQRAKQDAKFNRLWNGDSSDYGDDDSRADIALCLKILFYLGKPDSLDSIFRSSRRYREKWDTVHVQGKTYGQATIEKAVAGWNGNIWKEQEKNTGGLGDGKQPETLPAGFKMNARGLWYAPEGDSREVWVCGPLKITARTRNIATGTGWGKLIEFADPNGKHQQWAMPMRELGGKNFIGTLYDMGLEISTMDAARALFARFIQEVKPIKQVDCVEKTGWHEGAFVLPDACISAQPDQAAILENPLPHNPYSTAGTLADWQKNVAARAAGNSRLVFAISTAFAAPLLGLLGHEENGGFHFRGMSSEGKTVIMRAAASVWGNAGDYLQRWRATAVGIEQVAVAYNDTLLCLDEIGQVDPHTAGEVAYMLANGQGKLRGAKSGGLRRTEKWRMLFLSTGEISLAQHMTEGRKQSRAGQELRLADIPSNAGAGFGAFENLHGLASGADFAETITRAALSFYGVAGRAFLEKLVRKADQAAAFIVKKRAEFEYLIPKEAQGQAIRVARRFALVAAAGELATKAGITGWEPDTAINAANRCMNAWLEARGGAGQREIAQALEQVQGFFALHGTSRFTPFHRDPATDNTPNRAGFRRVMESGDGIEYFVFPAVFKGEVCQGLDWRQVSEWLIEKDWLMPTKDGEAVKSATRVERLPGIGNARVFRFRAGFEAD